jgi:transcriptional regulator
MYVPQHFEETDIPVLHGLIGAHPFATWVFNAGGELQVNHLPLLLDPARGAFGTLCGHVARPNPAWQACAGSASVAIFQGPQAYITPSWYPSKQEHGKAVPTWNYAVVHAHGQPRVIEDRDWLLRHVSALTASQERGQALPWQVTDAPADYIERMLGGIVGIEIPITRLVGKWKVSQNRPEADRRGVIAGLNARAEPQAAAMAELVRQRLPQG